MRVKRLALHVHPKQRWNDMFTGRDPGYDRPGTRILTVPCEESIAPRTSVRVELKLGEKGTMIYLRGTAVGGTDTTCEVHLGREEEAKLEYISGFVRGGMLDLRRMRRLPIRLPYRFIDFEEVEVSGHTRDINDCGVFLINESPYGEGTHLEFALQFPAGWITCSGIIAHTVLIEDEDVPGMGIVFDHQGTDSHFKLHVDELEEAFTSGTLERKYLL